jgi:hypothetical protein
MKWKTYVAPPDPNLDEKRMRLIFALVPHKCEDGFTRWLETIRVFEQYKEYFNGDGGGYTAWKRIGYAAR